MQIIGLCRFSYPGFGAFSVEFPTVDALCDYLYAPARIEERFAYFELFTLPSLRGQLDQDFTFLIVIGDSLPTHYRDRLEGMVSDVPQVKIAALPPGPHRKVMAKAIASVRSDHSAPSLQFRLDDDDAIGIGFVAHLRETAAQLGPFAAHHPQIALDYNSGFVARPTAQGIMAAPIRATYWSPALALLFQPHSTASLMDFGHGTVWKKMPTVTQTGDDMLLRGINQFNDSIKPGSRPLAKLEPLDADGVLRFAMSYNIHDKDVRRRMKQLDRKAG
jgi:putative rhamnosyltransferase